MLPLATKSQLRSLENAEMTVVMHQQHGLSLLPSSITKRPTRHPLFSLHPLNIHCSSTAQLPGRRLFSTTLLASSTGSTTSAPASTGAAASATATGASVAKQATAAASASSTPARPVTFGSRPFLHILTFTLVHVGTAWAMVPVVYAGLAMSGSANALLGGPQVAYILSRPIPQWIPFSGGGQKLVEVEDNNEDKRQWSRKKREPKQRTVEDLLDEGIRSSILFAWTNAASVYKTVRRATKDSGVDKSLGIKLPDIDGPDAAEAQEAVRDLKGQAPSTLAGWKSKAVETVGGQARKGVSDIHIGQIRDAVGAWVLVKLLFPLRLPLSLFLTPRVARFVARGMSS